MALHLQLTLMAFPLPHLYTLTLLYLVLLDTGLRTIMDLPLTAIMDHHPSDRPLMVLHLDNHLAVHHHFILTTITFNTHQFMHIHTLLLITIMTMIIHHLTITQNLTYSLQPINSHLRPTSITFIITPTLHDLLLLLIICLLFLHISIMIIYITIHLQALNLFLRCNILTRHLARLQTTPIIFTIRYRPSTTIPREVFLLLFQKHTLRFLVINSIPSQKLRSMIL
mmetsp:Transcript_25680/g.28007  ORF Transcript_25680/g.28007 Transcript_25680/m.28007 type:complete len:225 (-) Transcript_25680:823-1497(-)